MDRWITRAWFLPLGFLIAVGMMLSWPRPASGQAIRFAWAFGARIQDGQARKTVPVTGDLSLQTGDALKFFILLKTRCFVYLIHLGPQGEIAQLFPDPQKDAPQHLQLSLPYFIPEGRNWFVLDQQRGAETFYLLASAGRLSGLESLLKSYRTAPKQGKNALRQKILKKINLLNLHFPNPAATAERPARIGGSIRSARPRKAPKASIEGLAVEISADSFYSRTYTIDHR